MADEIFKGDDVHIQCYAQPGVNTGTVDVWVYKIHQL